MRLHIYAFEQKTHPGWPKSYMNQQAYVVHLMKLRIMHSLHVASANWGHGVRSVNVYEKPSRCVQAIGFHNKGALVLVPNTMTVKAKTGLDQVAEGEVCFTIPKVGWGSHKSLDGMRFVLSPMFSKDLPCAAWAVRSTPEVAKANMGWTTVKVSTVAVAEGPHERAKASAKSASAASASAKSASASVEDSEQSASEHVLEVPVMVNTKNVSNEQELVLYRPKQESVPKAKAVNLAKMITAKERGCSSTKKRA